MLTQRGERTCKESERIGFDRLAAFVDLERYPLHELDSGAAAKLIARCREMLREETLCLLEGFLKPRALEAIAGEILKVEADARRNDYLATAYGWMDNRGFPEEHPRRQLHRRDVGIVTTESLAPDGLCMALFGFDQLTEFIRRILGFDRLYRWECPTLGVMINVMREQQCFGWHFDANDFAVSFMVGEADRGGAFQYAPLIREDGAENYDAIGRIFSGEAAPKSVKIPKGAFTLFLGRRSLHRVAEVGETQRPRLSLLFSYDRNPSMVSPESVCRRVREPSRSPFMGLESLPAS